MPLSLSAPQVFLMTRRHYVGPKVNLKPKPQPQMVWLQAKTFRVWGPRGFGGDLVPRLVMGKAGVITWLVVALSRLSKVA